MARRKRTPRPDSLNDLPIAIIKEIIDRPPGDLLAGELDISARDMSSWVHRSFHDRMKEARRKGKMKRPLNAFFLYRATYYRVFKAFLQRRIHRSDGQTVSKAIGLKWRHEESTVCSTFAELANTERLNHSKLHSVLNLSATERTDSCMKRQSLSSTTPDPEVNGEVEIGRDDETLAAWTTQQPAVHTACSMGLLWPSSCDSGAIGSPSVPSSISNHPYPAGNASEGHCLLAEADSHDNFLEHWSKRDDQSMYVQYINPRLLFHEYPTLET